MYGDSGIIIGMKVKEKKYKEIIRKLLDGEELDEDNKSFIEKEGLSG